MTIDAVIALDEAEVRRMLGCWVSEIEPELVVGRDGTLLGLAGPSDIGDRPHIAVRASGEYRSARSALFPAIPGRDETFTLSR